MKRIMWLAALMFMAVSVKAAPYFQSPFSGGNWYVSQGALFTPRQFQYDSVFTNVALVYHPLSAGSIIPIEFQKWISPESWSINAGAGYNAQNGRAIAGPGISLNLLDSVRAYLSNWASLSSNASVQNAGKQIAPGAGPLNLTVGPQWAVTMANNGIVEPINTWKLVPRWFVGASYSF